MSDFFIGEIRMFSTSWAPRGWALCNGATLPLAQNQALFALLGTQFGGDGRNTVGLPDLQGRAPMCAGNSTAYGNNPQGNQGKGGVENVTLTTAQVPIHTHSFKATSAAGTANVPANGSILSSAKPSPNPQPMYGAAVANPPSPMAAVNQGTLNTVGGGAHNNTQPFTVMNFCISTTGLFPMRP